MEIRTIRPDEVDTFLRLLCDIFEIDFGRASTVFTSEPFYDLNRKWAAFEDGQMRAILTTTPLVFGWGRAIGISGVGTHPRYRGKGFAKRLLYSALERADADGEGAAYLFAADPRLYVSAGFKLVDEVIRGTIKTQRGFVEGATLTTPEVRNFYDHWASDSENRLRRNEPRWKLWEWHLRPCESFASGYLCLEVSVVREAIVDPVDAWPVAPGTQWVGLEGLTREIAVPLEDRISDAYVLAHGTSVPPQMFLTDQF